MDALPWHLHQEQRRCVKADGARNRSSRRWSLKGIQPPPSLLRRETEEFDLLHSLLPAPPVLAPPSPPADEETSSGLWNLSPSPRSPVEVAVDEEGFEIYDPAAFESSVTTEDFVADEVLETVTEAVQARSLEEVQAYAKRRCRGVEIEPDRLHHE